MMAVMSFIRQRMSQKFVLTNGGHKSNQEHRSQKSSCPLVLQMYTQGTHCTKNDDCLHVGVDLFDKV
jgi:hypothetical protein